MINKKNSASLSNFGNIQTFLQYFTLLYYYSPIILQKGILHKYVKSNLSKTFLFWEWDLVDARTHQIRFDIALDKNLSRIGSGKFLDMKSLKRCEIVKFDCIWTVKVTKSKFLKIHIHNISTEQSETKSFQCVKCATPCNLCARRVFVTFYSNTISNCILFGFQILIFFEFCFEWILLVLAQCGLYRMGFVSIMHIVHAIYTCVFLSLSAC